MNSKKQSPVEQDCIGDEILGGVDLILSFVIVFGKDTPIPFLSAAAGSVQTIVETIQAVKENKGALEDLAKEAKGLVAVLWGAYQQSHDQENWPPEELKSVLKDLVSTLEDIRHFIDDSLSRSLLSRIWHNKRDPKKLQKYKKALESSLERFKLCSHLTLNDVVMQMRDFQNDTKSEAKNKREDEAIKVLQAKVAHGASYDCDARSTVPKCHPGTREAIMQCIKDWVRNSEYHPFLWMYGPAGCGKTTIMGTIAKECDEDETLAASFFFSRSASDRPSENTRFVATLAYQLSLSIPEIRSHIANTITHDPNVFAKSLSGQMTELLIRPLNIIAAQKSLKKPTDQQRRLIVIDGLDECDGPNGKKAQTEILDLLLLASTQISSPFLFLVASRQEHNIQTCFSSHQMNSFTKGLPLDNDYRVDDDIKIYLEARFAKIKESHPARDDIPKDWPAEDDYEYLMKKASGQFIYVSVVMDFVESSESLPTLRLRTVRDELPQPENERNPTPFAPLDALYHHILSSINHLHLKKALEIVWAMAFGRDFYDKPSVNVYDDDQTFLFTLDLADSLFAQEPGESHIVLNGLRALIYLPDIQSRSHSDPEFSDRRASELQLRFFHASFVDFLLDKSRSGKFFIDPRDAHTNLARQWVRYYKKHSSEEFRDRKPDIPFLGFHMILHHCEQAILTPELQHDIQTLHLLPVPTRLRVAGNDWQDSHQFWGFTFRILQFVCWMKEQNPDTEKDLYDQLLHRIKVSLQIEWLKYGSEVQKFIPLAVTLPACKIHHSEGATHLLLIRIAMEVIDTKFGYSDPDPLLLRHFCFWYENEPIFRPATKLLCQILTDFRLSITKHDFDDQMQYAEFALMVAETILPSETIGYKGLQTSFARSSLDEVAGLLDMILSKAAPHIELGELLRTRSLQFDLRLLPNTSENFGQPGRDHRTYNRAEEDRDGFVEYFKELSVRNLLFIKRSGIRLGEHTHLPQFDPAHWCCAICTAKEQGIEIPPDLPPPPDPPIHSLQLAIPNLKFIHKVLTARMVPAMIFAGGIWFGLKRFFFVR